MISASGLTTCGPKDIPAQSLKLSVASRAPVDNPPEWKDLWKLSPFSIFQGGVDVPGLQGVQSKTVENAWQFLKIWEGEEKWNRDEALAAFESDCAVRFPRGRKPKVRGHYWGETQETLDYVSARIRIYFPLYCKMLELPDRQALIERLRKGASKNRISIWDYDSYAITNEGLSNVFETVFYVKRPFAHAFIVEIAVNRQLDDFVDHVAQN